MGLSGVERGHGLTCCPRNSVCHLTCTPLPPKRSRVLGRVAGVSSVSCWNSWVHHSSLLGHVATRYPSTFDQLGEWHHGWQCCSSSGSEHHFRVLLALRQEDGGALRHSPSSNNWQFHVHAKPRLHCGSPRSWLGGSGGVGCCPFVAAVHSPGPLCSVDQLEATDCFHQKPISSNLGPLHLNP